MSVNRLAETMACIKDRRPTNVCIYYGIFAAKTVTLTRRPLLKLFMK